MIRFFVYTNLKSWLQGGDPKKDIGSIRTFIIGGIAGAASVFGNTPVDVVKTRMQVRKASSKYLPARLFYYHEFNASQHNSPFSIPWMSAH